MPHQKTYWHGTDAYSAFRIVKDGFKLPPMHHGRVKGNGVYVAHDPANACIWGDVLVECSFRLGTRILWIDGQYDPRVIKSLSKEFGRGILDGNNALKHIPKNKRLERDELFHLYNYFASTRVKKSFQKGERTRPSWFEFHPLNQIVKMQKFDGVGEKNDHIVWDRDEVVVFNPSNVIPVKAYSCKQEGFQRIGIPGLKSTKELTFQELERESIMLKAKWKSLGFDDDD